MHDHVSPKNEHGGNNKHQRKPEIKTVWMAYPLVNGENSPHDALKKRNNDFVSRTTIEPTELHRFRSFSAMNGRPRDSPMKAAIPSGASMRRLVLSRFLHLFFP
jgi:hypothetical protein